MNSVNTLAKELKFNKKIPFFLKAFFYSDAYLAVLAILIFTSWITGMPIIGLVSIVVFATVILISIDDVLPIFPLFAMAASCISDNVNLEQYFQFVYLLIPLVIALVFHIIYYRKKFVFGKMFLPQTILSVAMFIGGCTVISKEHYLGALLYTALLSIGVFVIYIFFRNYLRKNNIIPAKEYFAKTMMYTGVLITIQIIIYYIRLNVPPTEWAGVNVDLGWGISNNIATLLVLTAPLAFYFAADKKYVFCYLACGIFQYIGLFLTFSRGGILFGVIVMLAVVVFSILKAKKRKVLLLTYLGCIVVLLILYFVNFNFINDAIKSLLGQGFGSSGRKEIYEEALECFAKYPIFGAGMGFHGTSYHLGRVSNFFWFHSTFFQTIASMGLFGLFAQVYFYITRYKIFASNLKNDKFNLFWLLSMIGFELYSLFDTATFIPFPFMTFIMIANAIVEIFEKDNIDIAKINI